MTGRQHVEILGHHMLLLAIPAFFPAVIVAGVVIVIAMRDRRSADTADPPENNDQP